jgi:hypothetical protein
VSFGQFAMRGNVLALVLANLPASAMAQAGPWVDLAQVMATHAEQVTTTMYADGTRRERLDLGDGLVIECAGVGADLGCHVSETGDVREIGCYFLVVAQVERVARACHELTTQEERDALSEILDRFATFVATNAVPSRSPEVALEEAGEMISPVPTAAECAARLPQYTQWLPVADQILSVEGLAEIDRALARQRLPLLYMCF